MPVSDPVLTTEAIYQERRKSVLAALAHLAAVMILCAVVWPVFFHNPRHFFQGDTLFWLANRYRSMNDALHAFTRIDIGGWYRPLTNATVESVMFPLFGMSPLPYRLIGFALFSATIGCVYVFQLRLAKTRVAALIACVFFTFHSVNAYVTYDAAFTPELGYAFFYVASTLLFVRSIRSSSRPALVASVTLFCVSLLCKEPAVTLPFTLVAIALFAKPSLSWRQRFWASVRPVRFHALVLAVYLVWTLGALGRSEAFAHAFDKTNAEQETGYQFAFDKTVLRNADTAMSLAFNLPRHWYSQSRLPRGMLRQLRVFRALMLLLLLGALIKGQIEPIAIGVIWFFVALAPALPLHNHFLPYYLFLPLVGFSLIVGTAFDFGYQLLRASVPSLSLPLVAAIFAQLVLVNARSVWNEQENNQLLGRSARIAQETVDTVRALKHSFGDQTIYFLNPNDGDLQWNLGWDGLFALSFSNATIHAAYASDAESHPVSNVDVQHLIVLDYRHEVLTDVTQEALKGRELSKFYGPRLDTFSLLPKDVLAGAGSYTVSMPTMSNRSIDILYALNNSAAQTINSYLNNTGEVQFPVGPTTQRGIYRFLGVRSGGNSWLYVDDRLVVH